MRCDLAVAPELDDDQLKNVWLYGTKLGFAALGVGENIHSQRIAVMGGNFPMMYRAVGMYLKELHVQSPIHYRFPVRVFRSDISASAIITTVGTTEIGTATEIEFEFLLPNAPDVIRGDQIEVEPGYFIGVVTKAAVLAQQSTRARFSVAATAGRKA